MWMTLALALGVPIAKYAGKQLIKARAAKKQKADAALQEAVRLALQEVERKYEDIDRTLDTSADNERALKSALEKLRDLRDQRILKINTDQAELRAAIEEARLLLEPTDEGLSDAL